MVKPKFRVAGPFAAFCARCAAHHDEVSLVTRRSLILCAFFIGLCVLLLRALVAHPLAALPVGLIGQAAFGGFETMLAPDAAMTVEPSVDTDAILRGMLVSAALVTGAVATLVFFIDCMMRAGAIAHLLVTQAPKLPEIDGAD